MADPASDASKIFRDLSNLEKSTELRVFLLMSAFIVFADCVLTVINGFGIYDFVSGSKNFESSVAVQLIVAFVAFSFFMSALMWIISILTFSFLSWIIYEWHKFLRGIWRAMRTDDQTRRKEREKEDVWRHRAETIGWLGSGFVGLHEIQKKAGTSKENEEYYLPWYEKEREKKDEASKAMQRTSLYALSLFYTCVLNIILYLKFGLFSLVGHILNDRKDDSYIIVFFVLIALLIFAYISEERTISSLHRVYCPLLAKELERDFRKWLDAERKFEDEIERNINKNKGKKEEPESEF